AHSHPCLSNARHDCRRMRTSLHDRIFRGVTIAAFIGNSQLDMPVVAHHSRQRPIALHTHAAHCADQQLTAPPLSLFSGGNGRAAAGLPRVA
ncbi:MAG: hypothetical protein ACREP7_14700, partial [Lysobacter sp.]